MHRIVQGSPLTVLVAVPFVVFVIVLLRDVALSSMVWAAVAGGVRWSMALEDGLDLRVPVAAAAWATLVVYGVSCGAFPFVRSAVVHGKEESTPPLRAIDEDTNRFVGVSLTVCGVHLAAATGGALLYSGVIGLLLIGGGLQLLFCPDEQRECYRLGGGRLSSTGGPVEAEWAGDPLFRAWARRVKERFQREQDDGRRWEQQRAEQAESRRQRAQAHREKTTSDGEGSERSSAQRWAIDDPWAVLGVEPGTSMPKITQKWRRLCKRYHPDVVPAGLKNETEEALKKINVAYRMIKEKRDQQPSQKADSSPVPSPPTEAPK